LVWAYRDSLAVDTVHNINSKIGVSALDKYRNMKISPGSGVKRHDRCGMQEDFPRASEGREQRVLQYLDIIGGFCGAASRPLAFSNAVGKL
jgi:hypothetical protein